MSLEEHQAKIAAQKRAAILDAARALFKEDGYERTTTDKAARLAEVSSATVCKHFPTKEQLFGAVMQCLWAEGASLELPSPPPGDPRAGIGSGVRRLPDAALRSSAVGPDDLSRRRLVWDRSRHRSRSVALTVGLDR